MIENDECLRCVRYRGFPIRSRCARMVEGGAARCASPQWCVDALQYVVSLAGHFWSSTLSCIQSNNPMRLCCLSTCVMVALACLMPSMRALDTGSASVRSDSSETPQLPWPPCDPRGETCVSPRGALVWRSTSNAVDPPLAQPLRGNRPQRGNRAGARRQCRGRFARGPVLGLSGERLPAGASIGQRGKTLSINASEWQGASAAHRGCGALSRQATRALNIDTRGRGHSLGSRSMRERGMTEVSPGFQRHFLRHPITYGLRPNTNMWAMVGVPCAAMRQKHTGI